ncbi:MAG: NTP transferase domain-containing protein [Desulfovibrio sp.]|nr:NTP transferase domain-containing protein [Desulfovibrio sp.]MBI4959124.1 NTP transferase domain-containing protein [Desulfovibrio sp.]
MRSVTAVILAGGLGSRLRDAVPGKPKVMAEVAGRPFLDFVLDLVESSGVAKVVMSTGYMGDAIRAHYGDAYGKIKLIYSHEDYPLGTGGGLLLAVPEIRNGLIMVLNGDSFVDADLWAFVSWFQKKNAQAGIIAAKVPGTSRFGRLVLTHDGEVQTFLEKKTMWKRVSCVRSRKRPC